MMIQKVELAKKRWNMQILYADDNIYMRQTLKNMLTYLGYPNLTPATDGNECFRILSSEAIDMVIADFDMPGINGIELLRRVRADKKLRHIPFILISAAIDKENIQLAGEYSVDVILLKPFDINKFRETIIRSFESSITPNTERDLRWEGDDAIAAADVHKLESVVTRMAQAIKGGVQIREFTLLYFIAMLHMMKKEYSKARDLLLPAVEKNSFWVQFYDIIADSFNAEGNTEAAFSYFKKGIDISPANSDRLLQGIALARAVGAITELRQFLDLLEKKTGQCPEDILITICREYAQLDDHEKVRQLFNRVMKERKNERFSVGFYRVVSESLVKLGEFDRVLELYGNLIKTTSRKDSEYPHILLEYALFSETKYPQQSLVMYEKIVELFPEFAEERALQVRIDALKKHGSEPAAT